MSTPRFDALAFVALFLIFFMGFKIFTQGAQAKELAIIEINVENSNQGGVVPADESVETIPTEQLPEQQDDGNDDNKSVIAPYDEYVLTQGVHGYSYGHMAIDITAGKGAKIHSPINGKISDLYVDQYGNTTVVIENNRFQITLLHGIYNVVIGQDVKQGKTIGKESNQGYTLDFNGNPCAGRDCGYHTHMNIYDKKLGKNVNPLDLIDS